MLAIAYSAGDIVASDSFREPIVRIPEGVNGRSSDEALREGVKRGCEGALVELFRRHARAVKVVGLRILRSEPEADDLVQEVFLYIFRTASTMHPAHGNATSWIIHLAYHRAFDRRRYLKSRQFYSMQEQLDSMQARDLKESRSEGQVYDRSLEGVLGRNAAVDLDSALTREQRETIQLFFFEGYTLKEIATRTGRSLVNVRGHYYRGLERMRRFIFSKVTTGNAEGARPMGLAC